MDATQSVAKLVRRLDYGIANQKGRVYIDGQLAGEWLTSRSNAPDRWLDSEFIVPTAFTQGKTEMRVRINFIAGEPDWNEFYYWVYCGTSKTDSLDVGKTADETAHNYRIFSQTWRGTRTYDYAGVNPVQAKNSEILEKVRLQMFWDDDLIPSVDAPLGLFFGIGALDAVRIQSLPVGVTNDGDFYSYFPMPFKKRALIQLVNGSHFDLSSVSAVLRHAAFTDSFDDVGYFRTQYRRTYPVPLGQDYIFLETSGAGHMVGVVLEGRGDDPRYVEGDHRFYLDGLVTPAYYGTGTEDYFNGGWYFAQGRFNTATHGFSHYIDQNRTMYRFHLSDVVTFERGGRFGIEHGEVNDISVNYQSVAFYYLQNRNGIFLVDSLDVGDPTSEAAHQYQIENQTSTVSRNEAYEGDADDVIVTDNGRYHRGRSGFVVTISPKNKGLHPVRRLDYGVAEQKGRVYVDNQRVGDWHSPGSNIHKRWREEIFVVPAVYTAGKNSVRIRIDNLSSQEWSEFKYWVYNLGADAATTSGDQAVRFAAAGDYLQVPHKSSLAPAQMTIEFWLRVNQFGNPYLAGGEQTVLDKRDGGRGYNIRLAGTSFPLGLGVIFEPNILFMPAVIESRIWQHVAVTQDASAIRLYINGHLKGKLPNSYAANTSAPLRIGEFLGYPGASLGLKGDLDEIRIWNYARSENQLRSAMHERLLGSESGLVAYWPFDGDIGNVIKDRTANLNDGTLFAAATLIASDAPIGFVPPQPPVGLRAESDGHNILLRWKPLGKNVSGSAILHRGLTPDFIPQGLTMIAALTASDSVYVDRSASPENDYFYRLQALDAQGHVSQPSRTAIGRVRPVLDDYFTGVYYYPWYGPHGHSWPGQYMRDLLAVRQPPQLGHYSSRDKNIIRQHLDWMEQYGIDFFVSSWWGEGSHENVTLRDYILPELTNRPLKFTVFFESPMLGSLVNGAMVFDAAKEEKLVREFKYIANTYFNHPNLLRIDGRPLLFYYLGFTLSGNYLQAFNKARTEVQKLGFNIYLVGDDMTWADPNPDRMQVWDAVTAYSLYGLPSHAGYPIDTDFYADASLKVRQWQIAANERGKLFIPNVHPGFNNRAVSNSNYAAPRQSISGADHTSMYEDYIRVLRPFVDPQQQMIMITSFNEWHEDTQIEPTIITAATNRDAGGTQNYTQGYAYEGYGLRFLEATRRLLAVGRPSSVADVEREFLPTSLRLSQNYPNPFNPVTTIAFDLPKTGTVRIVIYDLLGRALKTLVEGERAAGSYSIHWDGRSDDNRPAAAGIYFCRLESGGEARVIKLTLIK